MTKLKKDCTPEEWAAIRERAKRYDAKTRSKPQRKKYMRDYMQTYTHTDRYREKDNARYGPDRREAHLDASRKRRLGVTPQQVEDALALQDGKCAVCKRRFDYHTGRQTLHCADHCHDTGTFRGMLCRMRNTFEGYIKKLGLTPREYGDILQSYLENPPAQQEVIW